eukprot:362182_1
MDFEFVTQLTPPTWDRNCVEDYGAGEVPSDLTPEFSWTKKPKNGCLSVSKLLVAVDSMPFAFLDGIIGDKLEIVGTLSLPPSPKAVMSGPSMHDKQPSPKPIISQLCLFTDKSADKSGTQSSVAVLLVPLAIPSHACFGWTQKLFDNVKPERVVILDTISSARYISGSSEPLSSSMLRRVVTSSECSQQSSEEIICPFLEVPNLVNSVGASILQHCEVNSVPANLYVSIHAQFSPVDTVRAFHPVLLAMGVLPDWVRTMSAKALHGKYMQWMRTSPRPYQANTAFM